MSLRPLLSRYGLAAVILGGGITFSLVTFVALRELEREAATSGYEDRAVNTISMVRSRMVASAEVVRSVASLYRSSEEVTREEFRTFTEPFLGEEGGIQALEWVPRVRARERAAFEQRAREHGYVDFVITELTPEGSLAPAGAREEYFPILFVEPFQRNESALGFDVGSEAARLAALTRARDSGAIRATADVRLVQNEVEGPGMLVFAPVYRRGAGDYRDEVVKRRTSLAGFALGVFRLRDLVRAALSQLPRGEPRRGGIDFHLLEGADARGGRLLLFHRTGDPDVPPPRMGEGDAGAAMQLKETFELAGRQFTLIATPSGARSPTLVAWLPVIALLVGLAFTAAVFANLLANAGRTEVMRQLVDLRSEELRAVREELRSRVAGHEAAEAAVRDLAKITRYLSPQVYASISTGKQQVEIVSQRKKLTVLFCDIANFTETVERLESEDVTHVLNQYLTGMSRIGLEHGATIDKYIGDGIMVFFGDPETRGARVDALACVRMALAMQEHMNDLRKGWEALAFRRPLQCRIGISTGYCTVGNFGGDAMMNYTIVGSGVNLAARLQAAAAPGSILVSEETYVLVKDEVLCEEAPPIQAKGISEPVAAYRVVGPRGDAEEGDGVIREEMPALRIELNPHRMSPAEREQAAAALRRAVRLVAPGEEEPGPSGGEWG